MEYETIDKKVENVETKKTLLDYMRNFAKSTILPYAIALVLGFYAITGCSNKKNPVGPGNPTPTYTATVPSPTPTYTPTVGPGTGFGDETPVPNPTVAPTP
jgi:hypothetical protein